MNEINRLLSTNMKKARSLLGYSQLKLAELCGMSPSYIGDIEIGNKFPSAKTLQKIADNLKLKPHQLFQDESDNSHWNKKKTLSEIRIQLKKRIAEDVEAIIEMQMHAE